MIQAHPAELGRTAAVTGALQRRRPEFAGFGTARRLAYPARPLDPAVEAGGWPLLPVVPIRHIDPCAKTGYIGAMTSTATEPLDRIIAARLHAALTPSHLVVSNDSAQHRGHMGDDGTGETHFSVTVESQAFSGLNRVARQRLVNNALADLLSSRIHALAIRARAPGE
jgi:BolA protein